MGNCCETSVDPVVDQKLFNEYVKVWNQQYVGDLVTLTQPELVQEGEGKTIKWKVENNFGEHPGTFISCEITKGNVEVKEGVIYLKKDTKLTWSFKLRDTLFSQEGLVLKA